MSLENSEMTIIDPCQDSNNKAIDQTTIESGSKLETVVGGEEFEPALKEISPIFPFFCR